MTKVSPSLAEMTALAPPTSPLLIPTHHRSPSRSPTKTDKHITDLSDVLRDKERRVQQQLERCAEQRGRKMEEQRRREERRRNAAEERRRVQQEADKERLEAMVRRRGGSSRGGNNNNHHHPQTNGAGAEGQLDNRPKRWTWGGPPDGVEGNARTPPCNAIGSPLPNVLPASSASQSRHVADFLTPSDQQINKQLSNSSAALHSPERVSSNNHRLHRSLSNRRASPRFQRRRQKLGLRRAMVQLAVHLLEQTAKAQPRPNVFDHRGVGLSRPVLRDNPQIHQQRAQRRVSNDPDRPQRRRDHRRRGSFQSFGRKTTFGSNPERAEEKQRQEEERLREEEEQRRRQEQKERQERAAREAEVERVRREQERREREDEERRQKEQRWKDMQQQLDKEREEAFLRAQKEAERKRQEREQQHIQEEQERQQRKKRIEEIMKRTRKSDVEPSFCCSRDKTNERQVQSQREMSPSKRETSQMSEAKAEAASSSDQDVSLEPSVISLGPLENKSFVDELSDGVQSMDVSSPSVSISPVSREEQPSAHDFSPVTEADGMGWSDFSKLQPASGVGDLNKNLLIQACSADAPPVIPPVGPKLDVQ
ncbi:hypothetical protein WMY93_031893 [Mugilogobius chulae]|uniref:Ensconsin-like n=1 Tax=Mugilogobius chulae TaxID=88201 RepID=A0AAW0MKX1_9GOBI